MLQVAEEDLDGMTTAAERVYRLLLKKIFDNEFEPGKRLPRRKLAEMAGVSQIPVLEAMKRLEHEGLLEYKPRWGCVLAAPSVKRVRDMYALREAIECQVVRILAAEIDGPHLARLTEIARELDELRYSDETERRFLDLHHSVHMTMAEFAGRESLVSALRRANLIWMLWNGAKSIRSKVSVQDGWHMMLVNAIRAGDPDQAERIMRSHIDQSYKASLESAGAQENTP